MVSQSLIPRFISRLLLAQAEKGTDRHADDDDDDSCERRCVCFEEENKKNSPHFSGEISSDFGMNPKKRILAAAPQSRDMSVEADKKRL